MRGLFIDAAGRLRPIWGLGLFALCFWAASAFTEAYIHGHPMPRVRAMNLRVLAVLGSSAFCLLVERRPFAELGLRLNGRWWLQLLAGLGLGGGIVLLCALLNRALGGFHWESNPQARVPMLIGVGILLFSAALNEELLFRGYAFQRLTEAAGFWPAQGALALLFALAHWSNPGMDGATKAWGSLNIAAAAVLLGLARRRGGSLALPIGIHWAWNLVQGPILGFAVSGDRLVQGPWLPVLHDRPLWVTGGAFGLEATLSCFLVLAGLALLLMRPTKAEPPVPGPSERPADL